MPSRFIRKNTTKPQPKQETTLDAPAPLPDKAYNRKGNLKSKPIDDGLDNPFNADNVTDTQRWGTTASQWLTPGKVYDISGVHRNTGGNNCYCSFWGYEFIRTESCKRFRDGNETCHIRYVFRYPGGMTLNIYDEDIKPYTSFRLASQSAFKADEDIESYKMWSCSNRVEIVGADNTATDVEVIEQSQDDENDEAIVEPKTKAKSRYSKRRF